MFRKLRINQKAALALWGPALILLAVATVSILGYQSSTLEKRARKSLEPYVSLVSVGVEAAVDFQGEERANEILGSLRSNPDILEAHLILPDGKPLASYHRTPPSEPHAPGFQQPGLYVTRESVELVEAMTRDNEVLAYLHLTMSWNPLRAQTRQTLAVFGAGVLVLIGATLVQSIVMRRTVTSPITFLAQAAETVRGRGDYGTRVAAGGTDEVGRLAHRFNEMLEAIQQRESALTSLSESQRAILDHAAHAIMATNPYGVIVTFNPAAERMLGYRAAEVVEKLSPAVFHVASEYKAQQEKLTGELGRPVEGIEVFVARARTGSVETGEWTYVRKDGSRITVDLVVTAIKHESGEVGGFIFLANDVTERKRAESERERLIHELENKNTELERFTYTVSHDLKSPLITVKGFAGALRADVAAGQLQRADKDLARISDAADKMSLLLNDLLELSRIGRIANPPADVPIDSLVKEVLELLTGPISQRHVEIAVAGPFPVAHVDRRRIHEVFQNLIENALKFLGDQPNPRIEIGVRDTDGKPVFYVSDNGIGIPVRYHETVFGLFNKLNAKSPGTGIGLALVRRIIEVHDGKIWVESSGEGRGSTFCFTLPLSKPKH
jgi:PAS domain S-box-containing protein